MTEETTRYLIRYKDPVGLDDSILTAKITLTEGPGRDNETRGRIVVETPVYATVYISFDEFFKDYEILGKLDPIYCKEEK